jgi:Domain of unknown function (DUF4439)
VTDPLSAALVAEHAAIYGYGVVGAHLGSTDQDAARQAESAHRSRRDALIIRLTAAKQDAPPAAPAYQMPFPVTDRASAVRLAVVLEERTGRVWRQALIASTGDPRKFSLDALTDCAVRATRWRRAAGILPITVPFPGAPG